MRKPIQISGNKVLCDDGSIFRLDHDEYGNFIEYIWERLPDVPQDHEIKDEKETIDKTEDDITLIRNRKKYKIVEIE